MLNNLYNLICKTSLDYIYTSILELRNEGKIEEINKILLQVDINKITPTIMLGLLTATAPIKSIERQNFYNIVESRLLLMYNKERVEGMLRGLK